MPKKGHTAVTLIDHEQRDTRPGYKNHIVWTKDSDFPPKSEALMAERKRLHAEQKAKNDAWDKRKKYAGVIAEARNEGMIEPINKLDKPR